MMKIFVDSADIEEIKEAYEWGIVNGVTTNPSLIKQALEKRKEKGENIDVKTHISEILKIARSTPVSLEVTEKKAKDMIPQGIMLYRTFKSYSKNIVIKIPVSPAMKEESKNDYEGIKAIKGLSERKMLVNATLVFTPEQALLAAKAGATYVSMFAGRMDDYLKEKHGLKAKKEEYYPMEGINEKGRILEDDGIVSGMDLVAQTVELLKQHGLKTEVLAASLRNKRQVREAALVGCHAATIPFKVLKELVMHPKTIEGMKKFSEDAPEDYKKIK